MTDPAGAQDPSSDLKHLEAIYRDRWERHGLSPLSLGWTKGKQEIRFEVLLEDLPCENRSFLDIGCGFGDLNSALRTRAAKYRYLGIDLVPAFIDQATRLYGSDAVMFTVGNFLTDRIEQTFDYVLASGIFAFELSNLDNYAYIKTLLTKMFANCTEAVAVDFLSDRVNFRRSRTFYANAGRVLEIAFGLTRNLKLRHDYMPFEFSLTLYKDDRFDNSDTVFTRYNNARQDN